MLLKLFLKDNRLWGKIVNGSTIHRYFRAGQKGCFQGRHFYFIYSFEFAQASKFYTTPFSLYVKTVCTLVMALPIPRI